MDLVRPADLTAAGVLVSTSVAQGETAWDVAATYAIDVQRYKTISGIKQLFKSKAGANTGHDPETDDGTWWEALGPTNAYAMIDGKVQTQTTAADQIVVVLAPPGRITTLALLNVSGQTIRYVIEHPEDGVVADVTISLTSTSGIVDVPTYMLEPIVRETDLVITDLRWRFGSTLTVTVSAEGEMVGVGTLIIGQARSLGGTRWGASLGFDDYSVKQRDAFGNYFVALRAYSKRGTFDLIVPVGMVSELQRLLLLYRGFPVLFIGDERFGIMAIYGFVKNFDEVVRGDTEITANLELESVT
jgi:hypothetical protein